MPSSSAASPISPAAEPLSAAVPQTPCPCCDRLHALRALLAADDLDAAIDAGLMTLRPCPCAGDEAVVVMQTQQRLRAAWEARQRYRQRQARLEKRAAEREARRLKAPEPALVAIETPRPALPSGAAAILARAKAKAAERMKP